jgi:hypothetical protein
VQEIEELKRQGLSIKSISKLKGCEVVCGKFCKSISESFPPVILSRRRACGNVGKPSVFGEAFPSHCGNPRLVRISTVASFPSGRPLSFFFGSFFFLCSFDPLL